MLDSLVKSVCPEFPQDRKVKATGDKTLWFKIPEGTYTLYVPPVKLLKINMVLLNKFIESVSAFAVMDIDRNNLYDWENLNCTTYSGDECFDGIESLCATVSAEGFYACDIETKGVMWEGNKLLAIGIAINDNTSIAFYNIPEEAYPLFTKFFSSRDEDYV